MARLLILLLGTGDMSGEDALMFGHPLHRDRLERAPASICGACGSSVCCARCEVSPGHFVALWSSGGSHPWTVLAL